MATSQKGPESRHDQIKEHEPGLVLAGVTEVVEVVNQGIPMASRSGPPPLARVGLEAWRAAAPSTLRRRPWSAPRVGRRRLAPLIESAMTGEGRMLPVLMTTSAHVGGSPTSMTSGRSGGGGGRQRRRRRLYARIGQKTLRMLILFFFFKQILNSLY